MIQTRMKNVECRMKNEEEQPDRRCASSFFIRHSSFDIQSLYACCSASFFTLAIYAIRSRIRFEYPHSLSYHDRILCMYWPTERVNVVSTIDEFALWLKSIETSCSSE